MKTFKSLLLVLGILISAGFGFIDGGVGVPKPYLKDGSTALSGTGVAGADGWAMTVTKPQHWWYGTGLGSSHNDGAGSGPLNLTVVGSPTFGVDAFNRANLSLVTSAGNYTWYNGTSADVQDLGATFTIIWEFTSTAASYAAIGYGVGAFAAIDSGWFFSINTFYNVTFTTCSGTSYAAVGPTLSANKHYHLVYTQSGGSGILYVNGSAYGTPTAIPAPVATTASFTIGNRKSDGARPFTGRTHRVGVLKGTAWTPAQVLADYNAWHPCNEADTYARWYAATPTVSKSVNGVVTSPALDTWGAEVAGKYGYAAFALRYHRATNDPAVSPGFW